MAAEVLTVGYEGVSIDSFIETLRVADVEILVDVRALPLSRKPGFSKRALSGHLDRVGIEYVHIQGLGMPAHLRKQRHSLPENGPILDAYEMLLPKRDEQVERLMELADLGRVCVMCYEADVHQCHRSRLGNYLQARDPLVSVTHLIA